MQLIPVACLFLGNREAGTGTHFCGVLGLATNWLNFQLPESEPLPAALHSLQRDISVLEVSLPWASTMSWHDLCFCLP